MSDPVGFAMPESIDFGEYVIATYLMGTARASTSIVPPGAR